ncbi:MAG TPA: ATP-binding protein [Lacipirellulaceae bacterium]|jgi:signal transduction histidine kinase|nr:ATP-binding protein [Lacipirellulaceae bacterium]
MSYRTFKRVLGETSLERKCRWWFGVSLAILLTLSFTWYGRRTDQIVKDLNHTFTGPELVRAGWLATHLSHLDEAEKNAVDVKRSSSFYSELVSSSRDMGRHFEWDPVLPAGGFETPPEQKFQPRDALEQAWLADWSTPLNQTDQLQTSASKSEGESAQPFFSSPRGFRERYIEEPDGRQSYIYYQPMYAQESCVRCHKTQLDAGGRRPNLQAGDLMAMIRVTTDNTPTADEVAKNRAYLWTAAIVVGFVSMFSLWAVVRYVIVKPVTHLRDVANAVREGDVEKRAVIRTGDEFEELGAAFNRMLRQLLSQQSELKQSKGELDERLDELAQANMRLYEMNRLKSDFLATVSHELRTPLNSILGFSEVLSGIEKLDDKQRRYVGNIQRSGRMLLDMINDILDLAKVESGKMEIRQTEFKISGLISSLCEMARPLAEKKNIDLTYDALTTLPALRQDQAKVQQILNNLLSNAIKFTPEGGRISITAERDDLGDLRLKVTDTGIGISPDEQQLVFEKFRQASSVPDGDAMTREYSGTGLGLSIVRELCRLLGGDVSLESELGKGSTFSVRLPWRLEESPRLDSQLREDLDVLARNARVADALPAGVGHLHTQGSGV